MIFKLQNQSRQKVKILSKKFRDTQPNPRYSAKNNVAIRMIATFMPNFLYLSFIQLFHIFRSSFQILKLVIIFFKLVDKSKKSLFWCCTSACLQLILICFNFCWYRLFCLESRILSKFVFCEITLLKPLF